METRIFDELADYYSLWRDTCLGQSGSEKREADFLHLLFQEYGMINTVMDLGGGIGLHDEHLHHLGYNVTVFDRSRRALELARKRCQELFTMEGSFEEIKVDQTYDASICMWSTLSYVHTEEGRQNFYEWISSHTQKLIVLDQPNYEQYPPIFEKIYVGENDDYHMNVKRRWSMIGPVKNTQYVYQITKKPSGTMRVLDDEETQKYVPVSQLESYLGKKWKLSCLLGTYDRGDNYNREQSERMIAVFSRNSE